MWLLPPLALRVPATRIQAIIKGERAITADTALRLAQVQAEVRGPPHSLA